MDTGPCAEDAAECAGPVHGGPVGGPAPGELRRFYQELRQRGKAGKVALVAVDAQTPDAPARHRPPRHTLDAQSRPTPLDAKPLTHILTTHRYSRESGNDGNWPRNV